jgi:acyl carrier protein phosphodiesterase
LPRGGLLFLGVNYLAHIYLSGDDEDVMLGNFMADSVKGKSYNNYPNGIKNGILLHRFIDDFTDSHPICLETKLLLRPRYHKLSPILSDMIYDHLLAVHWAEYSQEPLRSFVNRAYTLLQARSAELTPRAQMMLPYMVKYDWLYNYQFEEGMKSVLHGMSRRVKEGAILLYGWDEIEEHRAVFENQFERFFSELIVACEHKRKALQLED